jgi:hypothetical protein
MILLIVDLFIKDIIYNWSIWHSSQIGLEKYWRTRVR